MATLSNNLASIVGGPVTLSENQQALFGNRAGVARMGQGMFGGGQSAVDVTDPASLEAEAQRLLDSGDRAGAVQMMQQARQIRASQASQEQAARAGRAERRSMADKARAGRDAAVAKGEENDAAMQEMQDRAALLREARDQGFTDIVGASRGMSNEQLSQAILKRTGEGRGAAERAGVRADKAAADAEKDDDPYLDAKIAAMNDLAEGVDDPVLKRRIIAQQKRVAAGGSFDQAYNDLIDAINPDQREQMGVIPNDDQVQQINELVEQSDERLDDLSVADQFKVATQVLNQQRNNPDKPIDQIVSEVLSGYNAEDDSESFGVQDDTLTPKTKVINFEDM